MASRFLGKNALDNYKLKKLVCVSVRVRARMSVCVVLLEKK